MICLECGWKGDIWELTPQIGDEFGNELCPACGSMDVIDKNEQREAEKMYRNGAEAVAEAVDSITKMGYNGDA